MTISRPSGLSSNIRVSEHRTALDRETTPPLYGVASTQKLDIVYMQCNTVLVAWIWTLTEVQPQHLLHYIACLE